MMEELFNGNSLNRSMEEIEQMYSLLQQKERILRDCIKCYMLRLLKDTSEDEHMDIEVSVYEEDIRGVETGFRQDLTQIWQNPIGETVTTDLNDEDFDPGEYVITTVRKSCGEEFEIDFDDYTTKEQMEILRELNT